MGEILTICKHSTQDDYVEYRWSSVIAGSLSLVTWMSGTIQMALVNICGFVKIKILEFMHISCMVISIWNNIWWISRSIYAWRFMKIFIWMLPKYEVWCYLGGYFNICKTHLIFINIRSYCLEPGHINCHVHVIFYVYPGFLKFPARMLPTIQFLKLTQCAKRFPTKKVSDQHVSSPMF